MLKIIRRQYLKTIYHKQWFPTFPWALPVCVNSGQDCTTKFTGNKSLVITEADPEIPKRGRGTNWPEQGSTL